MTSTTKNFILRAGPLPERMRGWQTLPRLRVDQMGDHHFAPRDACGRKRSPAAVPTFRRGVSPNSKGQTYEPTPYTDQEMFYLLNVIDKDMPDTPAWRRFYRWFGFDWRCGMRVSETLDLVAADLNPAERSILVRHGKGDKRRISPMDDWGWEHLAPWLEERKTLPNPEGHVFCVCEGPTAGERWSPSGLRAMMAKVKVEAMFEKRLAPHQLRHSFAIGMLKDGVPLVHVSRSLGHSNIATTDSYLRGISPQETIAHVVARPVPGSTPQAKPVRELVPELPVVLPDRHDLIAALRSVFVPVDGMGVTATVDRDLLLRVLGEGDATEDVAEQDALIAAAFSPHNFNSPHNPRRGALKESR